MAVRSSESIITLTKAGMQIKSMPDGARYPLALVGRPSAHGLDLHGALFADDACNCTCYGVWYRSCRDF